MRIFWQGLTWPRLSHRFDYAKLNEFDPSTPETTSTQTGSGRIRNRPETRARTRRLEVPRVRFNGRPRGPSHKTQEPARWRYDEQLDYALHRLSWQMSRRAPVETPHFHECRYMKRGHPSETKKRKRRNDLVVAGHCSETALFKGLITSLF